MSKEFSKIIMWIVWILTGITALLMAHFTTAGIVRLNTFARPFDIFAGAFFVIPIVICGGCRFWLARIRRPWLALLPFFPGVFFAWQAGLFGIYLVPEYCIALQILSGILFLVYLPLFVRISQPPPRLPRNAA